MKTAVITAIAVIAFAIQAHAFLFGTPNLPVSKQQRAAAQEERANKAEAARTAKASKNAEKARPWLRFVEDAAIDSMRQVDMQLDDPDSQTVKDYMAGMVELPPDRYDYPRGITVPRVLLAYLIPKWIEYDYADLYKIKGKDGAMIIAMPDLEPSRASYETGWVTWHKLLKTMSLDEVRKMLLFIQVVRGVQPELQIDRPNTDQERIAKQDAELARYWEIAILSIEKFTLREFWRYVIPVSYTTAPRPKGPPPPPALIPEFREFYTALFAGNVDECRKVVNKTVSDAAVAAKKEKARAEIAKIMPEPLVTTPAAPARQQREIRW